MDNKRLTMNNLDELLMYWKKRLLLNNWDLSIELVEFARQDYPQNGDIRIYPKEKKAIVLISHKPIKDEEYIIVHELVHLMIFNLDNYYENLVLKESTRKLEDYHNQYKQILEDTVDHLAKAYIYSRRKGND